MESSDRVCHILQEPFIGNSVRCHIRKEDPESGSLRTRWRSSSRDPLFRRDIPESVGKRGKDLLL